MFHLHKTVDMVRLCHQAFALSEAAGGTDLEFAADAEMLLSLCALYLRYPDFTVATPQHRRIERLRRRVRMISNATPAA